MHGNKENVSKRVGKNFKIINLPCNDWRLHEEISARDSAYMLGLESDSLFYIASILRDVYIFGQRTYKVRNKEKWCLSRILNDYILPNLLYSALPVLWVASNVVENGVGRYVLNGYPPNHQGFHLGTGYPKPGDTQITRDFIWVRGYPKPGDTQITRDFIWVRGNPKPGDTQITRDLIWVWGYPRGGAEHSATPGTFFVSESSNNK